VPVARSSRSALPGEARDQPPAGLLEDLFADLERALEAIDFLKSRSRVHTLRSLRVALYRARLDVREASLLRAAAIEVRRFLKRKGVLTDVGAVGAIPPADLTGPEGSGTLGSGPNNRGEIPPGS